MSMPADAHHAQREVAEARRARRELAADRRVLRVRDVLVLDRRADAEAEAAVASRFDDQHFDQRLRRPHVDLRDRRLNELEVRSIRAHEQAVRARFGHDRELAGERRRSRRPRRRRSAAAARRRRRLHRRKSSHSVRCCGDGAARADCRAPNSELIVDATSAARACLSAMTNSSGAAAGARRGAPDGGTSADGWPATRTRLLLHARAIRARRGSRATSS